MAAPANFVATLRTYGRSFWAANVSELFERIAFYGMTPMLVLYLTEVRGLPTGIAIQTGADFGLAAYGLPALSGFVADAVGYRRALLGAYVLLVLGYFSVGHATSYGGILIGLLVVAFGTSLVKPIITGTVQKTGTEHTRAVGFSVYYTLVNVGGALGPNVSGRVRGALGSGWVFNVSAMVAAVALLVTLLVYREPRASDAGAEPEADRSVGTFLRSFVKVVADVRLMLLFVFVAGWWSLFFEFFNVMPLYLRDDLHAGSATIGFVNSLEAITVIALQVVVGFVVRDWKPIRAVVAAVVISSVGVAAISASPSIALAGAGVIVFALGEMIYSAHFYHYLGTLAPAGQVGMYMGFAFLPIALGSWLSGKIGAPAVAYFRDVLHAPQLMWLAFAGVGAVSALGVFVLSRTARSHPRAETAPSETRG